MPTLEASATATLAGKYLTFILNHESYGIPVLKVREIIRLTSITTVPQMPAYVKGVINRNFMDAKPFSSFFASQVA